MANSVWKSPYGAAVSVRRFRSQRSGWATVVLYDGTTVLYRGRKRHSTTPYFHAVESTVLANDSDDMRACVERQCAKFLKGSFEEVRPARKRSRESRLNRLWREFEEWCIDALPESFAWPLSYPATELEVERTEGLIEQRFPSDLRRSWLKYNGSNEMGLFGVVSEGCWCSLAEVRQHVKFFRSLDFDTSCEPRDFKPIGPMKPVHWSDGWVPISDHSSGDHLCLDLDPPTEGRRGQLFSEWHEYIGPWHFVASSFEDFLARLVEHVQSSRYYWRHDGQLWPVSDESRVDRMIRLFQATDT